MPCVGTAKRKGGNCVVLARTRTGASRERDVHQRSFGQFKSVTRLSKCTKCIILIPGDPDNDLFGGYIDLFLKIKQESSGWPAYIQTEEEAFQYFSNYAARENVKLNSEAITKNPAMRSIAKLLLNSFWGKFGQRLNMPQTSFFSRN